MNQQSSTEAEFPSGMGYPVLSTWARRVLLFLEGWELAHPIPLAQADLRELFTLAPSGSLALVLDELCRLNCLIPLDDTHFRVGPCASWFTPRRAAAPSAVVRVRDGARRYASQASAGRG